VPQFPSQHNIKAMNITHLRLRKRLLKLLLSISCIVFLSPNTLNKKNIYSFVVMSHYNDYKVLISSQVAWNSRGTNIWNWRLPLKIYFCLTWPSQKQYFQLPFPAETFPCFWFSVTISNLNSSPVINKYSWIHAWWLRRSHLVVIFYSVRERLTFDQ